MFLAKITEYPKVVVITHASPENEKHVQQLKKKLKIAEIYEIDNTQTASSIDPQTQTKVTDILRACIRAANRDTMGTKSVQVSFETWKSHFRNNRNNTHYNWVVILLVVIAFLLLMQFIR